MSYYDYKMSQRIASEDYPFAALIMAAIRKADTRNHFLLCKAFPAIFSDLSLRYHAPGGLLPGETLQKELPYETK